MRLVLADQVDKLAGYLGLGLIPSGSSDPYGLRRAAGIAMEGALRWLDADLDFRKLLHVALEGYTRELHNPVPAARDVFRQRCETLFPDVRSDVLDAVLADPDLVFRPAELQRRIVHMESLAADVPFVQAATRPLNIVAAAEKKGIQPVAFDAAKLDSKEGDALLSTARSASGETQMPLDLKSLQAPIDAFFDSTMVMADDPAVRDARLAMLREVCEVLLRVGDFSKLVIPG
jgi:glycyl-tRNA synthetase beta chain